MVVQVAEAPEADLVLLERFCASRDVAAFSALVDRHQGDLLRFACAVLGDQHAAQDAVQEGFLRLARDAGRLLARADGRQGLGGWLCTVVRNHCFDQLRRRRPLAMDQIAEAETTGAGPACQVAGAEAGHLLWQAVERLPALERAAVQLRYRDGLPYADIAERLGKSVTHIGVILHQALTRLRGSPALREGVAP